MSATPRPWVLERVDPDSPGDGERYELRYRGDPDVMVSVALVYDQRASLVSAPLAWPPRDTGEFIRRAVNAFDALLAVAKAAAQDVADSEADASPIGFVLDPVRALDAAHPGWREWGEDTGKAYTQPTEGPAK